MPQNNAITVICAVWRDQGYHEIEVSLPVNANTHNTIDQALRALAQQYFDLNYDALIQHRLGVFGIIKNLDDLIADQDRIEIYEPLRIDPQEARLRRLRKKTQT